MGTFIWDIRVYLKAWEDFCAFIILKVATLFNFKSLSYIFTSS